MKIIFSKSNERIDGEFNYTCGGAYSMVSI